MRLPVAAKIALHNAGRIGGTPAHPPRRAACRSRRGRYKPESHAAPRHPRHFVGGKLSCSARPALKVIAPDVAALTPMTHAPSICARTRSGLIVAPQSIAISTRGMVIAPLASTETSHDRRGVTDEAVVRRRPSPLPLGRDLPQPASFAASSMTPRRRPVSTG